MMGRLIIRRTLSAPASVWRVWPAWVRMSVLAAVTIESYKLHRWQQIPMVELRLQPRLLSPLADWLSRASQLRLQRAP